jgi:hypothetical protein
VRTFQRRLEITVPAKGLFGVPPKRKAIIEFKLPASFSVLRDGGDQGAVISAVNFGGLREIDRKIEEIDNGVKLTWELKNENVFPLSGRTAFLVLELRGNRVNTMTLSEKYQKLRQRFLDRFYYQGRVAALIDNTAGVPPVPEGHLTFGDQMVYLGQALLAFATEIPILIDAGKDATDARTRISELLTAIEELETKASAQLGGPVTTQPNGPFVRDDITGPGDPRLGGKFTEVKSDWQKPEDDSPSGDQIFGLMFRLYGVIRYSGDGALIARARTTSSLLYDYARRSNFNLKLPNGEPTQRGNNVQWLASLLHGLNKMITGDDLFAVSKIELVASGPTFPLNGVASFWDSPTTADKVASLAGQSISMPGIDKPLELNSFALHILMMAIAPSEIWTQDELENVALKCNHHLAVLLYCQAHNTLPSGFDQGVIQQILELCPNTGPRASLPSTSGWGRDNRWVRCSNIFEPDGGTSLYNGVDWLLLHNFTQLVFYSE